MVFILCGLCISAQTKVAYLDLYQRGGGKNLITTIMYNQNPITYGRMNLGEALNFLADKGWVIDQTLVGARRIPLLFVTRHKFHIILKKEYQYGENPFEGLIFENDDANIIEDNNKEKEIVTNDNEASKKYALKELKVLINRKYYELRNNPSLISENITEFNSMVNLYRDDYVQLYGRVPNDVDNLLEKLMDVNSKNQSIRTIKELETSIKSMYYELKRNPSSILDNMDVFESKINEYKDKYIQLYGVTPYDVDDLLQKLMELSAKKQNKLSIR